MKRTELADNGKSVLMACKDNDRMRAILKPLMAKSGSQRTSAVVYKKALVSDSEGKARLKINYTV